MSKLAAALAAALPLVALAQEAAQPTPAPPQPPQYAPPAQGQYVAQPPPPYLRPQKQRDRWYIGFGLGGGNGRIKSPSRTFSFEEFVGGETTPASLNFKIGATVTPRLLLGFDLTAIAASAKHDELGYGTVEASVSIANLNGVATFFPMERGFFVRGGVGLSSLVAKEKSDAGTVEASASGVNLLAGVGYAFWLGRSFNLTVNLDVSGQGYDAEDAAPESSSFWTLGVGFDWY